MLTKPVLLDAKTDAGDASPPAPAEWGCPDPARPWGPGRTPGVTAKCPQVPRGLAQQEGVWTAASALPVLFGNGWGGAGGGCCLPGKQPRLTLRKRGMGPPAGCEGGSVAGGWGSPRRSKGPEGGEQPDRESRAARSSCCPGQRLPLAVSGLHFPCRWAPQCRVVHPCPQRKDPSISGTCPGPSSQ